MTDVSPSRRRLGRWLLAGGALALPLTASISYAAAAQDREVQTVELAPSDAPPAPPLPPRAPDAPPPPDAPDAPKVEKRVEVFKLAHDGDDADDLGPGEHRKIMMRVDGPMTAEQKKHFEEMRREWQKKGAEWQAKAGEWRKMAKDHQKMEFFAMNAPDVSTDCDKTEGSVSRSWTDKDGHQHVVICERVIREQARMGERQAQMGQERALMSLRMARNAVAGNEAMSASVKQEVLADLDKELSRLEADHK